MYADDLVLLSISVTHLQKLVNICYDVLNSCDLKLNPTKSVCMRVGPRFKITDCKIYLNEHPLVWKSDLRYLGLFILSGKRFKYSLQQSKQKLYRAANVI